MRTRFAQIAVAVAVLASVAGAAHAYPISRGTNELRPLIGATAAIDGQPSQFQLGLDWNYSLDGPLGFVLGWWLGFAERYIGMEVHLGVKYRFLRLHPRVAPFVAGGGGIHTGFDTRGGEAMTGIGFRFGGGVDFFATPRILPGIQMMFDLGPHFTNPRRASPGLLGSVQITFGCGFLL
jgi:opacity protein-like surface antigen